MRSRTVVRWLLGSVLSAAALFPAAALAQEQAPLALNRLNPAPAGDRLYGIPSPFVAGDMTPHAMLLVDYAHNPFILRRNRDGESLGAVVGNQLFLHLNASLALWQRINVNVDVPMALLQSGDSPAPTETLSFPSPSSAQLGDVRLGLRVRLIGDYFDPFQLSLGGYLWLPTGASDPGSYVSEGEARGLPQLIAGGRIDDRWIWSAAFGTEVRKDQIIASVSQGSLLQGGIGAGVLLGEERRAQVGLEVSFGAVASDANANNTNGEAILSGKYRVFHSIEAGAGLGLGLVQGIGTPDLRVLASIAYSPEMKKPEPPPADIDKDGIVDPKDACPNDAGPADPDPNKNGCPPPPDADKDGIKDAEDACPTEPGPANTDPNKNGCPPPPDRDKDGILDAQDACPDVAGVASEDAKKNGCPPDKDNDGVPDAEDACPAYPGLRTKDPATNGCPGDTDRDSVRDDQDACVRTKGKPNPDPAKNGCPVAVRVTDEEVYILQQVQFDTARATIRKESDELLDEVADVLKQHVELTRIEVQGHTDTKGNDRVNQTLSQNRANAVMAALVKRGVEASRLTAKGYGETQPIATNDTDEGRQKNRRVQFKILEKKDPPK
ncbi:MAG TPA: OmpA family protein [Polyangiaceae bacterium]|nr:OmpA family protein [Polyangiaceae bacterium]